MRATLPDWWKMIWDEEVPIVVMATKLVEDGTSKCEQYWPSKLAPGGKGMAVVYGEISVMWTNQTSHAGYTVNTFQISKLGGVAGDSREVTHVWVQGWPDYGVPTTADGCADPSLLLAVVTMVRSKRRALGDAGLYPVLVHCSAGVGRTGAVILTDRALDELDANGTVCDFRQKIYTRGCIEFHVFAPLEALPCV
jgi:protein tyrosine phosphatase